MATVAEGPPTPAPEPVTETPASPLFGDEAGSSAPEPEADGYQSEDSDAGYDPMVLAEHEVS